MLFVAPRVVQLRFCASAASIEADPEDFVRTVEA
jgi:hypothetical protein